MVALDVVAGELDGFMAVHTAMLGKKEALQIERIWVATDFLTATQT